MDEVFVAEEEEAHADVLDDLQPLAVAQLAVGQTLRVVLEVDFSICEGNDGVVAVVLGDVGADAVADVVEEGELVAHRRVGPPPAALLLDQPVPRLQETAGVHHAVHRLVDA